MACQAFHKSHNRVSWTSKRVIAWLILKLLSLFGSTLFMLHDSKSLLMQQNSHTLSPANQPITKNSSIVLFIVPSKSSLIKIKFFKLGSISILIYFVLLYKFCNVNTTSYNISKKIILWNTIWNTCHIMLNFPPHCVDFPLMLFLLWK